jgi:aminoacyl tRNA synthase complex-interacting multifunctional protein 1
VALDECFENLKKLNDELSGKSVFVGNGLTPSEADVIVFSAIHSSLVWTSTYAPYLLCF